MSETDIGEDLDEIGPPDRRAVDEVLPLGPAHEAPCDRDLGEVEIGPRAVFVVEDELDLAVLARFPIAAAREEDVVGLLGAKLGRRQRAGGPDDRIGDVRLAGAVRTDDDRHPRLERDLERVRERLEAAYAERAQVHRSGILATAPDVRPAQPLDSRAVNVRFTRHFPLNGSVPVPCTRPDTVFRPNVPRIETE